MTTSLDRWTGIARSFPFTLEDSYDIADILDTPDGFVVILNREENPAGSGANQPELTFMMLLKIAFDGKVIWRISISARDPNQGPETISYRTKGSSVIRTRDGEGFLVTGTVSKRSSPQKKEARLFVCRIDKCGLLQWIRTYTDDAGESAAAISIVALDTPLGDLSRYMIAAQGSSPDSPFFGYLGPAWVFVIDDDGNVIGDGVHHYGLERIDLASLRLLPTFGPVLVGRTYKREWIGALHEVPAWMLRVSNDGLPISEGMFLPRAMCGYPNPQLYFMDVAEGMTQVVAVGQQYGAAPGGGGAYVFLDGVPGPEGRTGTPTLGRALDDPGIRDYLRSISALTLEDDTGHKFRHFAITAYGWLARMNEAGAFVWEKTYKAIGPSTWYVFLHEVAWRSNGDIVAGGFFLPGTFIPGRYGAAPLVYSDSQPDDRTIPTCSALSLTQQTDMEVDRTPGPMVNDSFTVFVQNWTAVVDADGYVVLYCHQGEQAGG